MTRPKLFYLFVFVGIIYVAIYIFTNAAMIQWLFSRVSPESMIPRFFATARFYFGLSGLGLLLMAGGLARYRLPVSLFEKEWFLNALLLFFFVVVPLGILEGSAPKAADLHKTSIFIKDAELGWRLKPHAKGVWGQARVHINSHGLRGPEPAKTKPENQPRILFLGDSVTFGYGIEGDENTYPMQVESMMKASGMTVECINAGVGGYSPWQEYLYLKNQGLKWRPDLVVLSFVLNDVTEKIRLSQFGGSDVGYQLQMNVNSLLDHSNFYFFLKRHLIPTFIYGRDIKKGAKKVDLQYGENLVYHADDQKIQSMWDLTFSNLDALVSLCREQNVPLIIVMFPYTFQVYDVERLNIPQQRMASYAQEHAIPFLDLLPPFSARILGENADIDEYFIDDNHPTAKGASVAAEQVAEFIKAQLSAR